MYENLSISFSTYSSVLFEPPNQQNTEVKINHAMSVVPNTWPTSSFHMAFLLHLLYFTMWSNSMWKNLLTENVLCFIVLKLKGFVVPR